MRLIFLMRLSLTKTRVLFHLRTKTAWATLTMACLTSAVPAQTAKTPDITQTPTLYIVDYAHLDTQWRWNFPQTIREYLLKTMRVNFDYIDKYPHYVFNWTGANRYRLMKEYYPQDYARMQQYAAKGSWFPAGSSVEEGDVNLPSAEGLFRQFLYGQRILPQGFRQGKHRIHVARLLRLPSVAAQHPGPRRNQRLLHAEAQLRLAACPAGRRSRFS